MNIKILPNLFNIAPTNAQVYVIPKADNFDVKVSIARRHLDELKRQT